jgi:hypothetical protein
VACKRNGGSVAGPPVPYGSGSVSYLLLQDPTGLGAGTFKEPLRPYLSPLKPETDEEPRPEPVVTMMEPMEPEVTMTMEPERECRTEEEAAAHVPPAVPVTIVPMAAMANLLDR